MSDNDDWKWQDYVNTVFPSLIIVAVVFLVLTIVLGYVLI